MNITQQLHFEILKVCPIDGVSVKLKGDNSSVKINFSKEATDDQITTAKKVLADFDWNPIVKTKDDFVKELSTLSSEELNALMINYIADKKFQEQ